MNLRKQARSTPRHPEAITTSLESTRKIDLHRHLLGSARPATLWELAHQANFLRRHYWAFRGYDALKNAVVHNRPTNSLQEYIAPWEIFRTLIRTPDDIRRIAGEAAADAQREGVCYVEFRASLPGLSFTDGTSAQTRIPPDEYLTAIRDGFASVQGVTCRLVAAVTRHAVGNASPDELRHFTSSFFDVASRFSDFVVGVDLSGLETGWPACRFREFFTHAWELGLPITIHAGETEGPEEVWAAINVLKARRIGHGTTAPKDPVLVRELIERGIVLEVCPTAGWLVGAVPSLDAHPVIQSSLPLNYVICTDNPALNQSTQGNELAIAAGIAGADPIEFARRQFEAAARAAFDQKAIEQILSRRRATSLAGLSA